MTNGKSGDFLSLKRFVFSSIILKLGLRGNSWKNGKKINDAVLKGLPTGVSKTITPKTPKTPKTLRLENEGSNWAKTLNLANPRPRVSQIEGFAVLSLFFSLRVSGVFVLETPVCQPKTQLNDCVRCRASRAPSWSQSGVNRKLLDCL